MAFEELKKKQSAIWGTGPYERLPEHYEPLIDHLARAVAPRRGSSVACVAQAADLGSRTGVPSAAS